MKPVKKDHYICGSCGHEEVVLEGKSAKIMRIIVVGNEHQWCPDCVYSIKPWRKHVNEDHLSGANRKQEEFERNAFKKPMEHLNEKTKEILTVPH